MEWGHWGDFSPQNFGFLIGIRFLQYKSVLIDCCALTLLSKFSHHCMEYLVIYIAKKSHSLCYLFSIISACNIPCKLITSVYIGQCAWDLHAAVVMYSSKFCSSEFCDLPWFCIMIFSVKSFTLNCCKGILGQMHTWFLEIAFFVVCITHTHVCGCVHMCIFPCVHLGHSCEWTLYGWTSSNYFQ